MASLKFKIEVIMTCEILLRKQIFQNGKKLNSLSFKSPVSKRRACANITSSENVSNNKLNDIMYADMESAFKSVVSIEGAKKIIPEMYNLARSHTFVFKVPDTKKEYSMLLIDRTELMKPIFPNLTKYSKQMMLNKKHQFQSVVRNGEGVASNNPTKKSNTATDDWSSLGLDGWSGELTEATYQLESEHVSINTQTSIEMGKENIPNTRVENAMDISNNIYIARVNDPFGYSTKWSYRNKTDNFTTTAMDGRNKRDLIELYSMIKCSTGCEPLTYQSYGCFCGFLGSGFAVDPIDNCCKMHDRCYEATNCFSYLQYFVPYVWKCYRGKPICALDHGPYGGPTSCAALLCYCDVRLSLCLRKYLCPQGKACCPSSAARKLQNLFF